MRDHKISLADLIGTTTGKVTTTATEMREREREKKEETKREDETPGKKDQLIRNSITGGYSELRLLVFTSFFLPPSNRQTLFSPARTKRENLSRFLSFSTPNR